MQEIEENVCETASETKHREKNVCVCLFACKRERERERPKEGRTKEKKKRPSDEIFNLEVLQQRKKEGENFRWKKIKIEWYEDRDR